MNKEIIFLNEPIKSSSNDIIGVSAYVDKLKTAIDNDAQMIAITAPFGAGKSSVIELLEKKYNKTKKFIKISMWEQLQNDNVESIDLHCSFIYQLVNQINFRRGDYVQRRLSKNYGILRFRVNKFTYWILFIISALLLILAWLFSSSPIKISKFFLIPAWAEGLFTFGIGIIGIFLFLIALTNSEVVFSSHKSEQNKREIEASEIMQVYQTEILKHKKKWRKNKNGYVIIIEDLDRSSNYATILNFLKELRKYYIPQGQKNNFQNSVTFIVNIKPEALLKDKGDGNKIETEAHAETKLEKDEGESVSKIDESLYAKLFDYTLNLQKINVDNYDAVLEGILKEKEAAIRELLNLKDGDISDIPGIKWIIREPRLGIREIKERLNIAFSIYESSKSKFPEKKSGVTFEGCAIACYLMTAFEEDFYNTPDSAFRNLINLRLKNELTDESCREVLKKCSKKYVDNIKSLIENKLIDGNYGIYFYNYPKGSYLYSIEETQIREVILDNEYKPEIELLAKKVVESGSEVIKKSFDTLEQLGLSLPKALFESETLYCQALKLSKEQVMKYLESLNYDDSKTSDNVNFFQKILYYDAIREIYDSNIALELCKIWDMHFTEKGLRDLRLMLCTKLSQEIKWYKSLFYNGHTLISKEEVEQISIGDAIELVDIENESFDIELVRHIFTRYLDEKDQSLNEKIEAFLRHALEKNKTYEMVFICLQFMSYSNRIISDFEEQLVLQLESDENSEEEKDKCFEIYQDLINRCGDNISENTISHICELERYDGFNETVAESVKHKEHYIDYVMMLNAQERAIAFEEENIEQAIKGNKEWLLGRDEFQSIRQLLSMQPADILLQYVFMFDSDCPVLTEIELQNIKTYNNKDCDKIVMTLLTTDFVGLENIDMLEAFFNRKAHTRNLSFDILQYISRLPQEVAKKLFYQLDFDKIRYDLLSEDRRKKLTDLFYETLHLDSPIEKIEFMKYTRTLNDILEKELLPDLQEDKSLQQDYIDCANNAKKISKYTIRALCKFKTHYPMSDLIENGFLQSGEHTRYVSSTTLKRKSFEVAQGELEQILWPTYIKILGSSGLDKTRKYMSQNEAFIAHVMAKQQYLDFDEKSRLLLSGVLQDKASIENVMLYGEDFAIEYYSTMKGFQDEDAANTFIEIVKTHEGLIASDKLYETVHDKLLTRILKRSYTFLRKKYMRRN